ncbi:MAG: 50S ribosomal protein L30 [Candidatus Syntrophonatronum acetioxidans]|uniref:Large ribosomal subunit protein uL30 n=1 Tax=Candidatus Syntrophonatronum acetioxidans TaxID=1795816 RepID=A0A424YH77_9FIRM|nr:MAG: 50S ribosomal protein L30 [Candidatus Syntrophonatronum acetioxidans]
MKALRITLVKSPIGYSKTQRAAVKSLGLKKLNASRVHEDTPVIRGIIKKVQHLLKVEEIKEEDKTATS